MKAGWEIKKLGEVYDVRDGTHDSPRYQETGYPLITSKNLKSDGLSFAKVKYISEEDYLNICKRSAVNIGDVLFAMIGTIGNSVLVSSDTSFAIKNVALFKVPTEQNSSFLKYYLDSNMAVTKMTAEAKGTTQRFVGLGYLRNFPIPIPPLTEQQRIVAILDQAFEQIAIAKANAEQNLKSSRELFNCHLGSVFNKRGEGWEIEPIGKLAELNGRIGWRGLTAKEYTKSGPMFLSVHGLNYGDYVDYRDAYHISDERYDESPEIQLREGDVLICKDGAGIGKTGIVGKLTERATINSSLLLIRSSDRVIPKFLYFCLSSPYFQRIVKSRLEGATTPHLYQRDIKEFPIILPPHLEQHRIIIELDILRNETQRLESIYTQKIVALDELKQSILHEAFSGNL